MEFPFRILTGVGTILTVTAETRLKLDINDRQNYPRSFSGRLKNSPPEIFERFARKNWVRGFIKGTRYKFTKLDSNGNFVACLIEDDSWD